MDDEAHEEIAFSRSAGLMSPEGNADCEIKTRLSPEQADEIRRRARSMGMNTSQFARIVFLELLYGEDHVVMMTREQIRRVTRKGPQTAQVEDDTA